MIDSFRGQYSFMSNFTPVSLVYMDIVFPSVEHLFVALKGGNKPALGVLDCKTAAQAKAFGRTIRLRPDWEQIKNMVMLFCLRMKYLQTPFREKLLQTWPHVLREGNQWHDNYWGHCYCPRCVDIVHHNVLGLLHEQVRWEIRNTPNSMFWLTA